jgi:hypothetical protein
MGAPSLDSSSNLTGVKRRMEPLRMSRVVVGRNVKIWGRLGMDIGVSGAVMSPGYRKDCTEGAVQLWSAGCAVEAFYGI